MSIPVKAGRAKSFLAVAADLGMAPANRNATFWRSRNPLILLAIWALFRPAKRRTTAATICHMAPAKAVAHFAKARRAPADRVT